MLDAGYSDVPPVDVGLVLAGSDCRSPYRPPRSTERSPRYIPLEGDNVSLFDEVGIGMGTGEEIPISRAILADKEYARGRPSPVARFSFLDSFLNDTVRRSVENEASGFCRL